MVDANLALERRKRAAYAWVASTYFAEGYPYTIVSALPRLLFGSLGASPVLVGLASVFRLPWNLKFLWAPLVDEYETKRRWLLAVEVAVVLGIVALALVPARLDALGAISAAFVVLGFVAATHDVCIDGFYLESLDEGDRARFVGPRNIAYKLANLLVRGPAVVLAGVVGWRLGFAAMAALMALLLLLHVVILPRNEQRKRSARELGQSLVRPRLVVALTTVALCVAIDRRLGWAASALAWLRVAAARVPWLHGVPVEGWIGFGLVAAMVLFAAFRRRLLAGETTPYRAAFAGFMAQPRAALILAFVVTFRTGESFLQTMQWPFLHDRLNLSLAQYGVADGTFGVVAALGGTLAGGWLIARHGLRRWVWPFVLAQNVLHLLYVFLATRAAGSVGMPVIGLVITVEHLGEGLGSAFFTVFLMRCCDPAHKAAHMAIVTALMSVGYTVAGVTSGFLAQSLGFTRYFLFTFLITFPSMSLIFFLPYLDGRPAAREREN